MSIVYSDHQFIEKAGGATAIVAAFAAILLLTQRDALNEAKAKLADMPEFVEPETAEQVMQNLASTDRLDQLKVILLSATSSALQGFSNEVYSICNYLFKSAVNLNSAQVASGWLF